MEFSTELDNEDEDDEDDEEGSNLKSQPETLEQLLLTRNKKLTNEVTELRAEQATLKSKVTDLDNKLETTETMLVQSTKLNEKLEDDLVNFHDSGSAAMSMKSFNPSRANTTSHSISNKLSPTQSLFGGRDDALSVSGMTNVPNSSSMADMTILPIITQQRDRFRARNAELEDELRKEFNTIATLRGELESLQRDNLALYEKTRYISTYRPPTPRGIGAVSSSTGEDRYRSEYEETISPFAQFRGREQERAMSTMGPLERVVYGLTRIVLSNKSSRNLFFLYLTCLHVFVLGIIWYLAIGELSQPGSAYPITGNQAAEKWVTVAGDYPTKVDGTFSTAVAEVVVQSAAAVAKAAADTISIST